MRIIGITGPSGAGKTTALRVLRQMGAAVFDCDAIYHRLLQKDAALLRAIESVFPGVVQGGRLDRKALAGRVFHDPAALARLSGLTHPAVKREVLHGLEQTDAALAAIDAVGLFESGLNALCDVTVAVIAPEKVRLARLTARDGITEQAARERIAAQKRAEDFSAQCDITLVNDGSEARFRRRCRRAFRAFTEEKECK